jgi:hypothetical protein
VQAQGVQTLILQPANNTELLLVRSTTDFSDPSNPELIAEAWTSGGNPFNIRSLFKFNLSSIPTGATILNAKLSLYSDRNPTNGNLVDANFGTNNSMYIQRVTSIWDNSTLFQNTPSIDPSTQVLIPQSTSSVQDLIDIDVTSLVNPMLSTNYGFLIRLKNEVIYNSRIFVSSRHSDASKHPKLVITYQ